MIKYLKLITVALLIQSCDNSPQYTRNYVIGKTDDNNWSTSAMIECDSFTMVSSTKCIFYVDGRKSVLIGGIIKCYSNPK